ncbi:MAG: hypothetical protein ACRC14_10835 [Paracoccaceae bacterium]
MKPAFVLTLTLLAPLPAHAITPWAAPEGCEVFMTVQSRECRVSNHYRCTGDNPGDQWRADFDQDGIYFQSRINAEAEWVESYELFPTVKQVLDPGSMDPASFSDLLATGQDGFIFGLTKDTGAQSKVRGQDRLTGKTFVIDGITLSETEFEYEETDLDGNVLRRAKGNEYINPEWRLFFSGAAEWWDGEAWLPMDGSPLQFIFPGEPGFAATEPLFDCDPVLSRLIPAQNGLVHGSL